MDARGGIGGSLKINDLPASYNFLLSNYLDHLLVSQNLSF